MEIKKIKYSIGGVDILILVINTLNVVLQTISAFRHRDKWVYPILIGLYILLFYYILILYRRKTADSIIITDEEIFIRGFPFLTIKSFKRENLAVHIKKGNLILTGDDKKSKIAESWLTKDNYDVLYKEFEPYISKLAAE